MTAEDVMHVEVFMTASATPLKLVEQYPPPAILPKQTNIQRTRPCAPDFSTVSHTDFEDLIDLVEKNADAANREITRLRFENKRLEDELDSARMHPMHDPSYDRVNVDHALWLRQQVELRRINEYKTRYYAVVGILLAIVLVKLLFSLQVFTIFKLLIR